MPAARTVAIKCKEVKFLIGDIFPDHFNSSLFGHRVVERSYMLRTQIIFMCSEPYPPPILSIRDQIHLDYSIAVNTKANTPMVLHQTWHIWLGSVDKVNTKSDPTNSFLAVLVHSVFVTLLFLVGR